MKICDPINKVNTNYKSGYGLGAFYWEPAWLTSSSSDGTYYIRSKFSGKYLNIASGFSANNANLEQYSYSGASSQKF